MAYSVISNSILQGVPQNSLRFSFGNFLACNALRIFILDIFKQPFLSAVQIVQDLKDWAIIDQVIKEILTEEQNKIQQNSCST